MKEKETTRSQDLETQSSSSTNMAGTNYFFKIKYLLCFLKVRISKTGRKKYMKDVLSAVAFPQIAAMVRTELSQSQEPGVSSGSPRWVQWAQGLGSSSAVSQAISRELGCWHCICKFNLLFHIASP